LAYRDEPHWYFAHRPGFTILAEYLGKTHPNGVVLVDVQFDQHAGGFVGKRHRGIRTDLGLGHSAATAGSSGY
jgi:hypothetical protein